MTERRNYRPSAVLVLGCALFIGACGDDPSAQATVPTTVQPTALPAPEASSTPVDGAGQPLVVPERPATMDRHDELGAQAAAEYFVELYGYTVQSRDSVDLQALCKPQSAFCSGVIAEAEADLEEGTRVVGGNMALTTGRVDPPTEDVYYTIWGQIDREPYSVLYADGSRDEVPEGQRAISFAVLVELVDGDHWMIHGAEVGQVPAS